MPLLQRRVLLKESEFILGWGQGSSRLVMRLMRDEKTEGQFNNIPVNNR